MIISKHTVIKGPNELKPDSNPVKARCSVNNVPSMMKNYNIPPDQKKKDLFPKVKGYLVLALMVFLCLTSCRSTGGDPDVRYEVVPHKKSIILGELLAIFPGIIWHGLGHRYAGDHEKAEQIELLEAYSLLAGGAGVGLYFAGDSNDYLKSLQYTGYTLGGFGAIGFVGTWLYDIIYTPSAINRYNAGLDFESEL